MQFMYVSNTKQLVEAAAIWKKCPELAVDVECDNGMYHYGITLSLIQVSDTKNTWIVDVLSIDDASSLVDVLQDEKIVKVIHDVGFDARVLEQKLHVRPKPLWDTKIAAQLLGLEEIGLDALLKKYFNLWVEKKYQKADWSKRPLTDSMLQYAATDTSYLLKLKSHLHEQLKKKGRQTWIEQECAYLSQIPLWYAPFTFLDCKGAKSLSPEQLGVLRELFELREQLAQQVDRPVHFLLSNSKLVDFARALPKERTDWSKLQGVHPIVRRKAKAFDAAVSKGRGHPYALAKPKRMRLDAKQQKVSDQLLEVRQKAADALHIDAYLIISKDVIRQVCQGDVSQVRAWQKDILVKHDPSLSALFKKT